MSVTRMQHLGILSCCTDDLHQERAPHLRKRWVDHGAERSRVIPPPPRAETLLSYRVLSVTPDTRRENDRPIMGEDSTPAQTALMLVAAVPITADVQRGGGGAGGGGAGGGGGGRWCRGRRGRCSRRWRRRRWPDCGRPPRWWPVACTRFRGQPAALVKVAATMRPLRFPSARGP
jgi:hypothetical protein